MPGPRFYPQDYYHDDPVISGGSGQRKGLFARLMIFSIAIGGIFFLQTTLASNISLNSGVPVEFGQGILQTTACSGSTQIELTPSATFINTSGGGTYKFNSITVSGIPVGCHGSDFTINAYGETDSVKVALFNANSTDIVIYDNSGTFEAGIGGTGLSVTSSSGTFTVTFDEPVALTSSISKITIQSGAHAAEPARVYSIGDRGPGNGIVFYISANYFTSTGSTCNTTCKYLEVAPATWRSAGVSVANDPGFVWSTNTSVLTVQNKTTPSAEGPVENRAKEKFNWKLGQGLYNTSVMKVSGATSAAQAAVLSYAATDSSAGQWFIPSMNELNELCKYVRGQATGDLTVACVVGSGTFKSTANVGSDLGGFVDNHYWSSSEDNQYGGANVWDQTFNVGSISIINKSNGNYIRPIRAF